MAAGPKILYIREDHLIARIENSGRLPQDLTARTDTDPATIGAYLQTRNMILVCDHAIWTIETETGTIALPPRRSGLLPTAKIPAQRDGDQLDRERMSRSVWK